MATLVHDVLGNARLPVMAPLQRWRHRVAGWLAARQDRAQVLRELNACDERELRDLGISRYDFAAILDGTYRR